MDGDENKIVPHHNPEIKENGHKNEEQVRRPSEEGEHKESEKRNSNDLSHKEMEKRNSAGGESHKEMEKRNSAVGESHKESEKKDSLAPKLEETETWDNDEHRHSRGHDEEWDDNYSDEDRSVWGSIESDEEEEEDDEYESSEEEEEDEEDEDEDEEEEEEEEEESEEDEEIVLMRHNLVNSYLLKKALLKYLRKKNAYLQDRIYRTSVRKGMIIESELKKDKKKSRKHHKKDKEERNDGSDTEKKSHENKTDMDEDKISKRKKSVVDHVAIPQKQGKLQTETFSNEVKYQKIVRKIIHILQEQKNYEEHHQGNLEKHALRREEWREAHRKQLMSILGRIKNASEEAIDSNTGKRMLRSETEQFCSETISIHKKLCSTMVKMYKCRRGLELSTKRLDESEIQGEGLQMLEYEQLRAENQTLKDKLSDRVKDVDNIKNKITHGIQILAHFRAKMFNVNQLIAEGKLELAGINVGVYASRESTEQTVKRFERVKRDEQKLVVESGLLDNAVLLRDYEKTHFEVMALKEEKRKYLRELEHGAREVNEIRDRIQEIRKEYPLIMATPQEIDKLRRAEKRRITLFAPKVPDAS